jgi:hypothetical protein
MLDMFVIEFRRIGTRFQPELQEFVVADRTINQVIARFAEMVLEGGGWHGFSDRMLSINITIFREMFSLLLFIS